MNAICYKVIFSKHLGALVAVSEHATAQGKAASGESSRTGTALSATAPAATGFSSQLRQVFLGISILGLAAHATASPTGIAPTTPAALTLSPTALPTNGVVTTGAASIATSGANMQINQTTDKASINWNTFNVGSAASVNILQNNSSSVLLNRVIGSDPSQIMGKISANGQVMLINPNGVVFGNTGSVTATSFTASTMALSDADFNAGNYNFQRNGSTAGILNQGSIKTNGGYVALLGATVTNEGSIATHGGNVVMAAANTINIPVSKGGKVKLVVQAADINTAISNTGSGIIQTEGGQVLMQAASVRDVLAGMNHSATITHSGSIDTTGSQGGAVTLRADDGNIVVDGKITANSTGTGTATTPNTAGGDIIIGRADGDKGELLLADTADVSGATLESKGGFVETSGHDLKFSGITVKAKDWLLDPDDVVIDAAAADTIGTNLATTSVTIATTAGASGGTRTTDRDGTITVSSAIMKKVSDTDTTLTLTADNGIDVNANIGSLGGTGKLDVVMTANGNTAATGLAANSKGLTVASGVAINANGGTVTLTGTNKSTSGSAISLGSGASINAGGDLTIIGTNTNTTNTSAAVALASGTLTTTLTSGDAVSVKTGAGSTGGISVASATTVSAVNGTTFEATTSRGQGFSNATAGAIAATGALTIKGHSTGTSLNDFGVRLTSGVSASGNLVLDASSTNTRAIHIGNNSAAVNVSSSGGTVTITGMGTGRNTSVTNAPSVLIQGIRGSTISAAGDVTINGSNTADTSTGAVLDLQAAITSTSGDVTLNATNNGSGAADINLGNKITVNNKAVKLKADTVAFTTGSTTDSAGNTVGRTGAIDAGSGGTVNVNTMKAGNAINIGSASTGNATTPASRVLGLDAAALNAINASTFNIGSTTAGDITVGTTTATTLTGNNVAKTINITSGSKVAIAGTFTTNAATSNLQITAPQISMGGSGIINAAAAGSNTNVQFDATNSAATANAFSAASGSAINASGAITIIGTNSDTTNTSAAVLGSGLALTSSSGNIRVTGTHMGSGTGVDFSNGSNKITANTRATGSQSVTIIGTTASAKLAATYGVNFSTQMTLSANTYNITGTSSATTGENASVGVQLLGGVSGSTYTATTGNSSITGISSGTHTNSHGLMFGGSFLTGSTGATPSGALTLTGKQTATSGGAFGMTNANTSSFQNNGAVNLIAETFNTGNAFNGQKVVTVGSVLTGTKLTLDATTKGTGVALQQGGGNGFTAVGTNSSIHLKGTIQNANSSSVALNMDGIAAGTNGAIVELEGITDGLGMALNSKVRNNTNHGTIGGETAGNVTIKGTITNSSSSANAVNLTGTTTSANAIRIIGTTNGRGSGVALVSSTGHKATDTSFVKTYQHNTYTAKDLADPNTIFIQGTSTGSASGTGITVKGQTLTNGNGNTWLDGSGTSGGVSFSGQNWNVASPPSPGMNDAKLIANTLGSQVVEVKGSATGNVAGTGVVFDANSGVDANALRVTGTATGAKNTAAVQMQGSFTTTKNSSITGEDTSGANSSASPIGVHVNGATTISTVAGTTLTLKGTSAGGDGVRVSGAITSGSTDAGTLAIDGTSSYSGTATTSAGVKVDGGSIKTNNTVTVSGTMAGTGKGSGVIFGAGTVLNTKALTVKGTATSASNSAAVQMQGSFTTTLDSSITGEDTSGANSSASPIGVHVNGATTINTAAGTTLTLKGTSAEGDGVKVSSTIKSTISDSGLSDAGTLAIDGTSYYSGKVTKSSGVWLLADISTKNIAITGVGIGATANGEVIGIRIGSSRTVGSKDPTDGSKDTTDTVTLNGSSTNGAQAIYGNTATVQAEGNIVITGTSTGGEEAVNFASSSTITSKSGTISITGTADEGKKAITLNNGTSVVNEGGAGLYEGGAGVSLIAKKGGLLTTDATITNGTDGSPTNGTGSLSIQLQDTSAQTTSVIDLSAANLVQNGNGGLSIKSEYGDITVKGIKNAGTGNVVIAAGTKAAAGTSAGGNVILASGGTLSNKGNLYLYTGSYDSFGEITSQWNNLTANGSGLSTLFYNGSSNARNVGFGKAFSTGNTALENGASNQIVFRENKAPNVFQLDLALSNTQAVYGAEAYPSSQGAELARLKGANSALTSNVDGTLLKQTDGVNEFSVDRGEVLDSLRVNRAFGGKSNSGVENANTAGTAYNLSVNDALNTTIGYGSGTAPVHIITPKTLTLTAVADSKTYDGTTASSAKVAVTGLQSGTVSGGSADSVTASQSFGSRHVLGTDKSTLAVDSGYTIDDGNSGGNYSVSTQTASGTIEKRALTVTAVAMTKTYDGTTLSVARPLLEGLVGTDSAAVPATQRYDTADIGTGKTLTASGLVVDDGNGGSNYVLRYVANTGGVITAKDPLVTQQPIASIPATQPEQRVSVQIISPVGSQISQNDDEPVLSSLEDLKKYNCTAVGSGAVCSPPASDLGKPTR